jgi:hypothetical protein
LLTWFGFVDLVRVIAAPGRDQGVGARDDRLLVGDLGVGVGQREHDRALGHGFEHGRGYDTAGGEADHHVGVDHRVGQAATAVTRGPGERSSKLVDVAAVGVEHAPDVGHGDVLAPYTQPHPHAHAADGGRARADARDLQGFERLVHDLGGVA